MRRGIGWFVFLWAAILLTATCAAAPTIVGVSGDVKARARATASWEAAVKGQEVQKEAEIQCGPAARCIVALDETLQNTFTVKENTTVTVEDLEPGRIFLKEGRVFSIIKGVTTAGPFQVRTLTSTSGARGTAWLTDFRTGRTEVSVFEDDVLVSGIDAQGKPTEEIDVPTGQGVSVAADGLLGEIFVVSVEQISEWREEKQELRALREELGVPASPEKEEKTQEAKPPVSPAGAAAGTALVAGEPLPDTTGAPPVSSMSEEEKLLNEMRRARGQAQQTLGTDTAAGPEQDMSYGSTMPPLPSGEEDVSDPGAAQEPTLEEPMPETQMDTTLETGMESDDAGGMTDSMPDDSGMTDSMMEDPFMENSMLNPDLNQQLIDERHDSEMADSTNGSPDGSMGTTT